MNGPAEALGLVLVRGDTVIVTSEGYLVPDAPDRTPVLVILPFLAFRELGETGRRGAGRFDDEQ